MVAKRSPTPTTPAAVVTDPAQQAAEAQAAQAWNAAAPQEPDTSETFTGAPAGSWGGPTAEQQPDQAQQEQPETATTWGFSTDTATGAASPQAPQGEPMQIPAEDTEAAKVAHAKALKKAEKEAAKAAAVAAASDVTGLNVTKLVKFVERIERKSEEIAEAKTDLSEIFMEVKAAGYKPSILRKVLARRAMDDDKRIELEKQIALYEEALR